MHFILLNFAHILQSQTPVFHITCKTDKYAKQHENHYIYHTFRLSLIILQVFSSSRLPYWDVAHLIRCAVFPQDVLEWCLVDLTFAPQVSSKSTKNKFGWNVLTAACRDYKSHKCVCNGCKIENKCRESAVYSSNPLHAWWNTINYTLKKAGSSPCAGTWKIFVFLFSRSKVLILY